MSQLAAMAPSLALSTALTATPYNTTSLNTASSHTTGAVDSPEAFSTFVIGPDLNNLSVKSDYAPYQWALRNDDQIQKVEHKLDVKTINPIINTDGNGVGSVSLPPLGPSNSKTLTADAVKGIDINIQPAWEFYDQPEAKRPIVIAVVNAGINTTHPNFKDSMWVNEGKIPGDGIDNDGSDYIDDVNRWSFLDDTNQLYVGEGDNHGTYAAGTIAASRGNDGIAGINDGQCVRIMSLRALDGESGKGSPESIIAAIRYAGTNGAQIYNLSFGFENYTEEFMAVIRNSEMLFVMVAGNGDENERGYSINQYPVYPASLPSDNMIAVANLIFDGELDRNSSYGPVNVDLVAPGYFVLSMIPDRSYAFMTGTSVTAPMVAEAVATVCFARPDLDLVGIKNVPLASAKKLDTLDGRVFSGGILDVYSALQWGRPQ